MQKYKSLGDSVQLLSTSWLVVVVVVVVDWADLEDCELSSLREKTEDKKSADKPITA